MKILVVAVDVGNPDKSFGWAAYPESQSGCCNLCHYDKSDTSRKFRDLVNCVSNALADGFKVALGFEAPLFVPADEALKYPLTKGREGIDEGRPFSVNGGATSLVAGLAEYPWILRKISKEVENQGKHIKPTLSVCDFLFSECHTLLIWEAFVVSGVREDLFCELRKIDKGKFCEIHSKVLRVCLELSPHQADAYKAAATFYWYLVRRLSGAPTDLTADPERFVRGCEGKCFNLAGAALLWAGLLDDEIKRTGWRCVERRFLRSPCPVVKTRKP